MRDSVRLLDLRLTYLLTESSETLSAESQQSTRARAARGDYKKRRAVWRFVSRAIQKSADVLVAHM